MTAQLAAARPSWQRRFPVGETFDSVCAGIPWRHVDTEIRSAQGEVVFAQTGVEAPTAWSDLAVRIVASKYLRTRPDGTREASVRELIGRVVETIGGWAEADGYIEPGMGAALAARLGSLVLEQRASFNSPVWFNVGAETRPQCSACFILGLEDDMSSILRLAQTEGMLFKHGSGAGCNLSHLRGSAEALSAGGTASGPLPFLRGLDAMAGAIKSGGRTRRAAKMAILDDDHPDLLAFVASKRIEEAKARALIAAGWDGGFAASGGAYESLGFQNANHSVRVSDALLEAAERGDDWALRRRIDGTVAESVPAREVLHQIAAAAWDCGDPGLLYRGTIDGWHTCPAGGPIRASNPCAEFLFLDDTACNLASLNLLRFWDPALGFDVEGFVNAVEVLVLAQEVLVDRASYPTPAIAENSRRYRPLGLGFANLGALLLAAGLPYDSVAGRSAAAAIAALLTGAAYRTSARIAADRGPFEAFAENRSSVLGVLERHRSALEHLALEGALAPPIATYAKGVWLELLQEAEAHGVRHAQVTALAPTGTIAFMMDCDTTGVEPELALVKHKQLVGGGSLRLVNRTVARALEALGYGSEQRDALVAHLEREGTLEHAAELDPRHLPVFDCALPVRSGGRAIAPRGHLSMVAALQPFVSGGISKTVNVPQDTSVDAIVELYLDAWRAGLKALSVYRDGCKGSQPLTAGTGAQAQPAAATVAPTASGGGSLRRRRLPVERPALTHKFRIGPHKGYVTVGLFEDGSPGEVFLVMSKEGSTIAGLLDALATTVSLALQHGVPLSVLVEKLTHTRFEPSGFTGFAPIPFARSVTDYLFRWLGWRFLKGEERQRLVVETSLEDSASSATVADLGPIAALDAPICHVCGALMVPAGTCYRCGECGASSGCG